MFEYHGWIAVWEGSCEAEDDSVRLRDHCREIRREIEKYAYASSKIELFYQNGGTYVRFDGCQNHYTSWVVALFIRFGEIAKGSHGLLYLRDDESPDYGNEFQVWRMAKGKAIQMRDNLLSPCYPMIEN